MPSPVAYSSSETPNDASTTGSVLPILPQGAMSQHLGLEAREQDKSFLGIFSSHWRPGRSGEAYHSLRNDASSSPRLAGYIFCFLANAVLLISAAKFKRIINHGEQRLQPVSRSRESTTEELESLIPWKIEWAWIFASIMMIVSLFLALAHFDTCMKPAFWSSIFKDGSISERNIIAIMASMSAVGVYICTSALSVGNQQPNVYFSSWLAFFSQVNAYEVWRLGADLPTLYSLASDATQPCTLHWIALLFCATVTTLSVLDLFLHSNRTNYIHLDAVADQQWFEMLCISGSTACISLFVLILNQVLSHPITLPLFICSLTVDWKRIEGLILFGLVGLWIYAVFEYTGDTGYVHGPTNTYFGIWSIFLLSVFAFGTWFKYSRQVIVQ
mmetsp:Transcript_24666/g.38107  ORF Transcript_24666/g.38107 Transcript_24666/m.38107 type:complete len:386 (-) Transcript_24666:2362-3519(-)